MVMTQQEQDFDYYKNKTESELTRELEEAKSHTDTLRSKKS